MMNTVTMLTVSMAFGNTRETVHPVLLQDGANTILIDCGFVGSLPIIEAELEKHHVHAANVTGILLTHQDHDHMGAAAAFKEKYPTVKIYASAQEEPYISGRQKPLRLVQAEQMQKILPPEQQEFGKAFCAMLKTVKPVGVDVVLHGGDDLEWCGGCRVMATPGHTPGHIALYLKQSQTVITGDAIALENSRPVLANPQFALEPEQARASMERLLAIGAKRFICYHGGEFGRA